MGFPRGYLGAFETGPVTNDELVNLPGRFRLRGEIGLESIIGGKTLGTSYRPAVVAPGVRWEAG